jgi:heat shock protein HtpX
MNLYNEIAGNKRGSFFLIGFFILFITGLGWVFGEISGTSWGGTVLAFIFASISGFVGYYFSDKIVLGISGARAVDITTDRQLFQLMENLCIATGLPMPKLYVIEDTAPNAFATGRDPEHAVICVTTGLLQKLDKRELEGVLAHELAHVKNYDIRLMSLVVVFVGVVALLSDWILRSFLWGGGRRDEKREGGGQLQLILIVVGLVLAILAPIVATLIKFAISRKREYLADASAALITRYPEALAQALEKIALDQEPLEAANKATAHLYIINPLKDHASAINNLFSTHPPVEERIRRLRAM